MNNIFQSNVRPRVDVAVTKDESQYRDAVFWMVVGKSWCFKNASLLDETGSVPQRVSD